MSSTLSLSTTLVFRPGFRRSMSNELTGKILAKLRKEFKDLEHLETLNG
jgi:hypothetical protein